MLEQTTALAARRPRVKRAAIWVAIVLGYVYAANDGPIPALSYMLCLGVMYLLVVVARRRRRSDERVVSPPLR